jgi:hypothetical protein
MQCLAFAIKTDAEVRLWRTNWWRCDPAAPARTSADRRSPKADRRRRGDRLECLLTGQRSIVPRGARWPRSRHGRQASAPSSFHTGGQPPHLG